MKKQLIVTLIAALSVSSVSAKSFNSNFEDQVFKPNLSSEPLQLRELSEQEMLETEGEWWFIALPLARTAIWAAPKISRAYRVVNNTKSQHTILLKNNVHRVQIGTDRYGKHVGWGANPKNGARFHIYKNNPWRVNPY